MRIAGFLFLIYSITAHAQTLVFAPNEYAAGAGIAANQRPRLAYSDDGILHLIWAGGSFNASGVYQASAAAGEAFGEPELVSGSVQGVYIDLSSGPTLRARGNYLVAGWEDMNHNNRGTWAVRSTDSGATWEIPVRADPRIARMRYYQSIGIFPDGRMAQMWMTHDASGHHPTYEWAVQTGDTTFSSPVDAAAAATMDVCDCCPPDQLVLDDGLTVLTAFRNNISNLREIHVTRSTDGGTTFPEDYRIDTSNWILPACPVTGPHMAHAGQTVLVTWMSALNDTSRIWMARSLDGGASWEPMQEVSPNVTGRFRNYPQVAIRDNIAVIVWEGANEQFGSQIWASVSTDAGATWSAAVTVTDDPLQSFYNASVAIAPDYSVAVVWRDIRTGPPLIYRAHGTLVTEESDDIVSPTSFVLTAYPNPFNATVRLSYDLSTGTDVTFKIFDLNGREVKTLLSEAAPAGSHSILWSAEGLPSGIYLAQFSAGETSVTQKLVLLK